MTQTSLFATSASSTAPEKSETDSILRVRKLSRMVTRVADTHLRQLNITASQFDLLRAIANSEDVTYAHKLGVALEIEKSTLSRNLKRMVNTGLIQMGPPAGRIGRELYVTLKGQELLPHAAMKYSEAELEIAKWLPNLAMAQIKAVTGKIMK